jgi:hypothetical protein
MKIKELRYVPTYSLFVRFEDGVEGQINLEQLVEKGIFQSLKNTELFSKAYATTHAIAWSDELEIDAIAVHMELSKRRD